MWKGERLPGSIRMLGGLRLCHRNEQKDKSYFNAVTFWPTADSVEPLKGIQGRRKGGGATRSSSLPITRTTIIT